MYERILAFGAFQLLPGRSLLLHRGRAVKLGSRAFKILLTLVERAGEVVTKDELMAAAWPNVFVDDANIKVQLSALRKVLSEGSGERYITNLSGRGYSFAAPVNDTRADPFIVGPAASKPTYDLPGAIGRLFGRGAAVDAVADTVMSRRLTTLVGPGGIGKTTVALAAARQVAQVHRLDACYVDLASLAEPTHTASAVAAALGLFPTEADALTSMVRALRDRTLLLVLDNCERLVEPIAVLVEAVLQAAPGVSILATSREPLKAAGEWVNRLDPLAFPKTANLTTGQALAYPAVELFVERAAASHAAFELSDANVPAVLEICRRLDGMPLAIELAAAQVAQMDVTRVARGLDDRFNLLRLGRRTSVQHHQTLRALLDWSHDLLSPAEQTVLRRLAVFSGGFDQDLAIAVAGEKNLGPTEVMEAISELISKSVLGVDISDEATRYRMLETTRAYAVERLDASADRDGAFERMARALRGRLNAHGSKWLGEAPEGRLPAFRDCVDDVRSALDWCLAADARQDLSLDLTVAAIPVWLDLSMLGEGRARIDAALALIAVRGRPDPVREMMLLSGLGIALFSLGGSRGLAGEITRRSLGLAISLGDVEYQLKSHWTLYGIECVLGNGRQTKVHADAFGALASQFAHPWARSMHHRMTALAEFLTGHLPESRLHGELALQTLPQRRPGPRVATYHLDHELCSRAVLSRTLWTLGHVDDALAQAESAFHDALALGHPQTLCVVTVSGAATVALWSGRRFEAARYIRALGETARRNGFGFWMEWAVRFEQAFQDHDWERRDQPIVAKSWSPPSRLHGMLLSSFDSRHVLPAMINVIERDPDCAFTGEILRGFGEQMRWQSGADALVHAAALFDRATDIAKRQGARGWELRTAISRGRLLRGQGLGDEAMRGLEDAIGLFDQGAETADIKAAARLMAELETAPAQADQPRVKTERVILGQATARLQ
jgi:predicted ATPase/DNA-binding winged helix-turn-helix (wHTH) protein